ncbi:MAG: ATPase [Propionibacteriales bacterium]|nr:ATPase [Propionibacteriales bacterium]
MTSRLKVTMPSEREIALTRVFAAPRRLVFNALTQPELLVRWFGARGWNLTECEVDLRTGGRWRFVSQGPDGAEMGHGGIFREVVVPDRLVYTEVYDDQSYPGESVITHVLAERDHQTTLTSTVLYPSPATRDLVLRYPMARGVGESYDRLDAVLADIEEEV